MDTRWRGILPIGISFHCGQEDLSGIFRWCDVNGRRSKRFAAGCTGSVGKHDFQMKVRCIGGFIANLGLYGNHCGFPFKIEPGCSDVCADGLQIIVQRQREVDGLFYIQIHVSCDAALNGVEILLIPLVADAGIVTRRVSWPGLLHITGHLPRGCVVRCDGNQVFTGLDPRRDVESDGRDACFIVPREMAVHIQVNSLSDALEFEEQLFAVRAVERDFLAVEHEPSVEALFARIRDQRVERIVRVDRMRHADHLPVRIIVVRLVELFPVLHHALHGVRERESQAFCLLESPVRIHVPDIFTRNVCRLCIQRKHDQCGEYAENCRNKSVSECDGANHGVCRVHFHAKPFLYVRKSRSFMLYPQL